MNSSQLKKAMEVLILKGKDLPTEGLEVLKNASSKDARQLAKVAREKNIRSSLSPEGDSFTWDAYYATHKPVSEALGYRLNELEPNEADWLTDVFEYDKGKLKSLQDVTPHTEGMQRLEFDITPEQIDQMHKDRWKEFYKYMFPVGAAGLGTEQMEEPEGYASGGVVKKGASQLRELLENLHKTDPERMARAKAAGYDVDNIQLHGTDRDFDTFDRAGAYLTDDPDYASWYAKGQNGMGSRPETDGGRVIPVFVKVGNTFDSSNYEKHVDDYLDELEDNYAGSFKDWLYENKIIKDYPDIELGLEGFPASMNDDRTFNTLNMSNNKLMKSIFNDFTEDSLASDKFAKGGLIEKTKDSSLAAMRAWLDGMTLGQYDELTGRMGANFARRMRPELFEEIDQDTLIAAAQANQTADRHKIEEEHPMASIVGSLATAPVYGAFGGSSLGGQMAGNAILSGAYRYGNDEEVLDPTSVAIDLSIPLALRNLKKVLVAGSLAVPSLLKGDKKELSNLEDLQHSYQMMQGN